MENCIFCKIINGDIPSTRIYEDENCIAFHDIQPQAKVHILVVPKHHVKNIDEACNNDKIDIGNIIKACTKIARKFNLDESGYRLISNMGKHAKQSVEHLHFHIIGGEELSDKMA